MDRGVRGHLHPGGQGHQPSKPLFQHHQHSSHTSRETIRKNNYYSFRKTEKKKIKWRLFLIESRLEKNPVRLAFDSPGQVDFRTVLSNARPTKWNFFEKKIISRKTPQPNHFLMAG